jgi:hypothetical protein
VAKQHGRPLLYLESAQVSKEDKARSIMEKDGNRSHPGLAFSSGRGYPCRWHGCSSDSV